MSTYSNYWNKVSLVKSKRKQNKKIDSIGIGLASPEEIRRWGERRLPNGTLIGKVDKDHTVDYESLKPIEGGLFCERIFGPVKDFYCSCERKGEKNEKFCPNCEVEFTKSRVRRIRMGYIPLAVPVVHVWYLRGRPSYIANLVGKSRNSIDRLAYGETLCESFIGSPSLESIYKKEDSKEGLINRVDRDDGLLRNGTSLPSCISLLPSQDFSIPSTFTPRTQTSWQLRKESPVVLADTFEALPWRACLASLALPLYPYGVRGMVKKQMLPLSKVPVTHAPQSATQDKPRYVIKRLALQSKGVASHVLYFARTGYWAYKATRLSTGKSVQSTASELTSSRYSNMPNNYIFGSETTASRDTYSAKVKHRRFSVLADTQRVRSKHCKDYPLVKLNFVQVRRVEVAKLHVELCTKRLASCPLEARHSKDGAALAVVKRLALHSKSSLLMRVKKQIKQVKALPLAKLNFYALRSWQRVRGSKASEQKYFKFHTLPLFSTFVYKEWSHRFSFLDYFIWSPRTNDLVLPFYTYQNSRSEKSRDNICESIRKNSINLIRNKFSLRFSNKNNLSPCAVQRRHSLDASNLFCSNALLLKKSEALNISSRALHETSCFQPARQGNHVLGTGLALRRFPSYASPLYQLSFGSKAQKYSFASKDQRDFVRRSTGICSAFSTIEQYTESTPLNKMDTQLFPRLTELLNFTGGAALRNLLSRFDLIVLSKFLRHELKNLELKVNNLLALKMLTYSQGLLLGKLAKRRSKQIRRLKLLELFQSQKSNPEWMILSVIPVLPPDLRPILGVNDDFIVASDLNRLYQTVLRRNNTIHERLDDPLPCPESGLFRQRSLQKAVDGLLENGKGGGTPLCASKRRPLVSLSDVLKGKKGLFRQHLLGKRVDYSGRSVIVVGPKLQLHECGLPKEMAIELFQPFLLHRLKVKGLATSNTTARRMIQQGDPVIWHILKQLVYEHPVLLNRAPTLHRLGIQAFQPRLVSGRAILLHPLVCNGFNADFDGDQMAVHVPLSFQARAEAWKIMWSKNNFLSPATGQPILVPSQDMVLGCYYLSVSIPRILDANVVAKQYPSNVSLVSHEQDSTNKETFGVVQSNRTQSSCSLLAKRWGVRKLHTPKEQRSYNSEDLQCLQIRALRSFPSYVSPRTKYSFTSKDLRDEGFATGNKFPVSCTIAKHRSTFLNKNKGHYFSNLQDSLLAYFQGRLQTHTPFWVRIDPVSFPLVTNNVQFHKPKFTRELKPQTTLYLRGLQHSVNFERIAGGLSSKAVASGDTYSRASHETSELKYRRSAVPGNYARQALPLAKRRVRACFASLAESKHDKELTFLQPLYGSSQEMCKTLFQNKSTNNNQIRVEANETLESPLELRLSNDGNLAHILTMFQNHYNYNATWIKQCKEESIKYMRTTAGRVVINKAVFKDF